jgi:hypothetical protein
MNDFSTLWLKWNSEMNSNENCTPNVRTDFKFILTASWPRFPKSVSLKMAPLSTSQIWKKQNSDTFNRLENNSNYNTTPCRCKVKVRFESFSLIMCIIELKILRHSNCKFETNLAWYRTWHNIEQKQNLVSFGKKNILHWFK